MLPLHASKMLDRRPLSAFRACASLVLLLPLLAGCFVGAAAAPPTGGGSLQKAAAGDELQPPPPPPPQASFVRVGEVTPASEVDKDGTEATIAAEAPKPRPGKHEPQLSGATAPSAAARVEPPDANRPPPPPPNLKAAVVDSAGGLSEAEIKTTVIQNQGSFRRCYELGQAQSSAAFSGSVMLRVTINAVGVVVASTVAESTTRNVKVDSCVATTVSVMQFPKKGNGAIVTFPVDFGAK